MIRRIVQVVSYDHQYKAHIVLDENGELWQYKYLPGGAQAWAKLDIPQLPLQADD